jgi:CubicO group peptidase (beta-lactamase class C family)
MVDRRLFVMMLLTLALALPSCHFVRYFYWNLADLNDYKKFPAVPIVKGEHTFTFHQSIRPFQFSLPDNIILKKEGQSFESYLTDNHSVAFLIIRHDTIIYENYFDGYDEASVIPSFSVSKSFVSALVGIAIEEGYIDNVDQPVTDYLADLKDPGFRKVRIVDLLNMRSGLLWDERYASPFALMPKYYYGTDLKRYARKLKIAEPPDHHYDYQSANTFLLGQIVEKATGRPLNEYLEEKIWKPAGMESDASWSIDSKKNKAIKSFCCLNAKARDFARFGRLYLYNGNWNGQQLIPASWVEQTRAITNDSRDSGGYPYQYQWRITPDGALFAKGILGQYIYIKPDKEIIIVRLGKSSGKSDWPKLFKGLSEKL